MSSNTDLYKLRKELDENYKKHGEYSEDKEMISLFIDKVKEVIKMLLR